MTSIFECSKKWGDYHSSMVFNGWQFIRDDYSGEIVFSNMKVPTISRHEFVEVFQDEFSAKNNTME